MVKWALNFFLKRKLQNVNGEFFYKGVSVTKIALVAIGVLKFGVEGISTYLHQNGLMPSAITVPGQVYEFLGGLAVIGARDAVAPKTNDQP